MHVERSFHHGFQIHANAEPQVRETPQLAQVDEEAHM
jgi:hypothetical protein